MAAKAGDIVYGRQWGNSADKLRMPRICCLFSCWISSRFRHAELVCTSDYIDKPISRYRSPTTLRCDIVGQIEPTISCKSHPT